MAKAKKEGLQLEYILQHLPSAQHKTGLAGLVLLLKTMKERKIGPLPGYEESDNGAWALHFTRESFQTLFDELYDAKDVEIETSSKWNNVEPLEIREKEEITKDGKKNTTKIFVYEVTLPKGAWLEGMLPQSEEGKKRLKLWRDMLWAIYRGKPAARGVYLERAQGKPCSFTEKLWKALEKNKGSESLAGSLLLGAEGANAERIAFKGSFEENLLLHFTHVASPLFVARSFSVKRGKKDNNTAYSVDWNENGYVLVMPEIINLTSYIEAFREWMSRDYGPTKGYRPTATIIDLPEESGLKFLADISERKLQTEKILPSMEGVEYYHMAKKGNAVKVLTSAQIPLTTPILREYSSLVKPEGQHKPLNFLYKTLYIQNLLNGMPWYNGMEKIFETYPAEFFIWSREESPRNIPFFGKDIRQKLKVLSDSVYSRTQEAKRMKNTQEGSVPLIDPDERLAAKTRNIVRQYVIVELKTNSKSDLPEKGKTHLEGEKIKYSPKYQDAVSKICKSAFLALRGRTGADIAEFFTGTLCSHAQPFRSDSRNPANDDYLLIAKNLIDPEGREKIKLFAMLALCACSWVYSDQESSSEDSENAQS